ncbi:MAG: peptidylprolyl isomerase [Planctomycetota bacterium]|nr:peptidylprolyl isomerase [Planctomycetota bacterium]
MIARIWHTVGLSLARERKSSGGRPASLRRRRHGSLIVNIRWMYAAAALVATGAGILTAQDAPATKPSLAATVGSTQITTAQIDQLASKQQLPPDANASVMKGLRQMILNQFIHGELLHSFLEANKASCTPDDVDKVKKDIEKAAGERKMTFDDWMAATGMTMARLTDLVRAQKLLEATASDAKVDEYIKAHPSYFNGTKVQASHILIACNPLGSTEEQKAAIKKLEGLAEEIKSGKLTFAMAATLHSSCPSKAKGGDLGEFAFESMVPQFAKAAFDAPTGTLTGVIRTRFGFHLIKVGEKKESKDAPKNEPRAVAKAAIQADIENQILDQAMTSCPITIIEK